MEQGSNILREWYVKGQAHYRTIRALGFADWFSDLDVVNGELQELTDLQREGFLMGWQSDDYATKNNMPLSQEGMARWEVLPSDISFAKETKW